MAATIVVPSATLDNVPGASGAAQNGHLIYAVNTGRWWFFTYQGKKTSGTASSGSTSQLVDNTQSWTAGAWLGMTCIVTSGAGSGQAFTIGNNTSTTLPVVDDANLSTVGTAFANGSVYEVIDGTKVHAWVSSSSDLTTATWSEATGSPSPAMGNATDLGKGINIAGGSNNSGGSGQFPTDGRLLHVGYANVSSTDVIQLQGQEDSHYIQATLRARITAATTIAWDGVISGTTDNWDNTAPGEDCAPEFPQGASIAVSSTGRFWFINDQNGRVACGYAANVVDSGAANQDPNWQSNNGASAPTSFDSGIGGGDMTASALIPLASGFMLAVYCQGNTSTPASNGNATQTGLRFCESASATQWPTVATNGAAVPNLSSTSNDPNDWGIALRTNTDIHAVRRDGATTLEQVRYSGHNGSWGAKVTLPTTGLTGQLAGSGVALVSDGTSVWCFVIDTDANHSIRYIKWTVAGGWDASWSTLSTNNNAKNFINAYIRSDGQQIGVMWTENASSPFQAMIAVLSFVSAVVINARAVQPRPLLRHFPSHAFVAPQTPTFVSTLPRIAKQKPPLRKRQSIVVVAPQTPTFVATTRKAVQKPPLFKRQSKALTARQTPTVPATSVTARQKRPLKPLKEYQSLVAPVPAVVNPPATVPRKGLQKPPLRKRQSAATVALPTPTTSASPGVARTTQKPPLRKRVSRALVAPLTPTQTSTVAATAVQKRKVKAPPPRSTVAAQTPTASALNVTAIQKRRLKPPKPSATVAAVTVITTPTAPQKAVQKPPQRPLRPRSGIAPQTPTVAATNVVDVQKRPLKPIRRTSSAQFGIPPPPGVPATSARASQKRVLNPLSRNLPRSLVAPVPFFTEGCITLADAVVTDVGTAPAVTTIKLTSTDALVESLYLSDRLCKP